MKRQFISISVVRHCEPTPANKISYDQTVQFALSDAQAAFQFVPFGRSVSVINCDSEKRKRLMQLVWNEHLHKNSGGVTPPSFFQPTQSINNGQAYQQSIARLCPCK
jgi:hypothetical protein